ncbi:polyhydroxyalkanoic acid synthase PhaR subunit [Aneurinibacillus soli]|uniref:Poly(3-hydroxyalkanoate) polymerase subunit PhaE n=1 Tax=Aneurinibacillus soli TaxID=1500254 RepID=A0A0U5B4H0_9BACL|nr:polyhydroxyalkanoic acid synthase subunit PhaR [Aneurinibacillus soli]PYE57268.1 polyhydroxyalkanoic acid synthase PhaR subunit [Aneurinibacillus soli]BAU29264.1 poly(hydroxyalcanoate) granule associated protein phasin [Aneurinibacillus soli]
MNNKMPFDPFAMWKDMYDKTESHWSKAVDESMRKEDFSEWMGQFLSMYLQYQNMIKQSTENYLEQANMPSRADISNLASLIVNLEAKVDDLEEMIEEDLAHQINNLNVTREVNRLKTDVKNLDKKLDEVIILLKESTTREVISPVVAEAAVTKEVAQEEK